ncbi:MAG: aspartate dehydrogenase domain-containing protein [Candidatus Omnitrophota bacterium]
MKKTIGIIGCGTIGTQLAKAIEKRFFEKAKLLGICDADAKKAKALQALLGSKPKVMKAGEIIKRCELIIEAASATISANIARSCIVKGKDVMIMSVGGILKDPKIIQLTNRSKAKLYIPSGAICAIDAVKAANIAGINEATLITAKPPHAYSGAAYVVRKKINLSSIKTKKVIFEGPAAEAAVGFAQNINVAATLSLAGIGAKKTHVKIIADPALKRNTHQVEVRGKFGVLSAKTENVPSPGNPKTSYLAVLSAIATLKGILENVKIGS